MGIYLVSVAAEEWFGEGEDGMAAVAAGLNAELERRGRPPYLSVPVEEEFLRGSGRHFEEKLSPPMTGFAALCRSRLSGAEAAALLDWSVLVPVPLAEAIRLPVGGPYDDETVVAGAPQVLALAERLAAAIGLPAGTPDRCDNLDLTTWFLDGAAERLAADHLAAGRTEPWCTDLGTAFYTAVYLRAAQHALRHGCPIVYC